MVQLILFWTAWVLAGIANSLTDWYGFSKRGNESWKKYKQPMEPAPLTFYYKLTGLAFKEKFFLSGTMLVFLTDKFHFYQFVQVSLIITTILLRPAVDLWLIGGLVIVWGLVTHTSYIFVSKRNSSL